MKPSEYGLRRFYGVRFLGSLDFLSYLRNLIFFPLRNISASAPLLPSVDCECNVTEVPADGLGVAGAGGPSGGTGRLLLPSLRASRDRRLSVGGLVYPLLCERRGFFRSVFFAEVIYTQYNLSI